VHTKSVDADFAWQVDPDVAGILIFGRAKGIAKK
jgi:hypothetical protein